MTDEEKIELVRRCTHLIKAQGRIVPGSRGMVSTFRIAPLEIVARRPSQDPTVLCVPEDDKDVTKGNLHLLVGGVCIFRVPHRVNVRRAVLRDSMWPNAHLGHRALEMIRQFMVLDDLAGV